jgi:CheY-like chemotaxis protein
MRKDVFCLLIDDDPDDRDIFLMAIERLDISLELDYACSGPEGLKKLEAYYERLPDYIFLDMNMQIMNGKQCLTEIKKIPKVAEVPVIIYSTTINEQIIYETLELGAFDHIQKPTELGTLCKYLKRIFQVEEHVSKN